MQTVAKAGPADLIAHVWFALGFRPRESLVVVGLEGPRNRCGLIVRAELEDAARPGAVHRLLAGIRAGGAEGVVAIVASEQARLATGRGLPPLVRTVRREAGRLGLELVDVLRVGPRSYRSYLCREAGCCPFDGHPLEDVMSSPAAAAAVLDGRVVAPDEASLVADVVPAGGVGPAGAGGPGTPDLPGPADLAGWLRLWDEAVRRGSLPAAEAGALAGALDDDRLRDAVLTRCLPGARDLPEAMLSADPLGGAPAPGMLGRFARAAGRPPDREQLAHATDVLAAAARSAAAGARAPALAVLAWIAWWSGASARSRLLVGLARQDRPGYRLTELVDRALLDGVPPPWVPRPGAGAGLARTAVPDAETTSES